MHLQIVEADRQLTRRYVVSGPHRWAMDAPLFSPSPAHRPSSLWPSSRCNKLSSMMAPIPMRQRSWPGGLVHFRNEFVGLFAAPRDLDPFDVGPLCPTSGQKPASAWRMWQTGHTSEEIQEGGKKKASRGGNSLKGWMLA